MQQAEQDGRLSVLLGSEVISISTTYVEIDHRQQRRQLPNDAIIVCAGGILPTPFLKDIGIEVETKFGTV